MVLDFFKKEALPGPDFQGRPLSILHLSDLHFRDPHFGDLSRNKVARRFFRALARLLDGWRARYPEDKELGALFVAGDITYQCRADDFEAARDLIGGVLEETGIPGQRVYVAPGEHDVYLRFVKNTDDTLQFENAESWNQFLRDERKGRSQRISGRFAAYLRFLQSLGEEFGAKMPCASSDFFYADVFAHAEKSVAVLGLNSAWSCRCRLEADRGMLCLGSYQVGEAYQRAKKFNHNQDPDLVLSLLHHPAEWMKPGDSEALNELARLSHLVFRGHTHKGEQYLGPAGSQAPVLSISSCCGEDPLPGFALAALDLAAKKVYLWPYLWNPEEENFLPATPEQHSGHDQAFCSFDLR